MARHVALLRGINLGSHRRVAMGALREHLSERGYGEVATLLQSGNVILSSSARGTALAAKLERDIGELAGFDVPVLVRSAAELAAVIKRDPLRKFVTNDKRYQVTFLAGKPAAAAIRAAAEADAGDERFAHIGRELYTWHPDGIHRSSLMKLLSDKRLGVTGTARNWSTVLKLLALAED